MYLIIEKIKAESNGSAFIVNRIFPSHLPAKSGSYLLLFDFNLNLYAKFISNHAGDIVLACDT